MEFLAGFDVARFYNKLRTVEAIDTRREKLVNESCADVTTDILMEILVACSNTILLQFGHKTYRQE